MAKKRWTDKGLSADRIKWTVSAALLILTLGLTACAGREKAGEREAGGSDMSEQDEAGLSGLTGAETGGALAAEEDIAGVKVCYMDNPIGVDEKPTFSWRLGQGSGIERQTAYRILVTEGEHEVWDSGKVASDDSLCIAYEGDELQPCTVYEYQIRCWDENDKEHSSGGEGIFETGVLKWDEYWPEAEWIYRDDMPADMTVDMPADVSDEMLTEMTVSFSLEGEGVKSGVVVGDMDNLYDEGMLIILNDESEDACVELRPLRKANVVTEEGVSLGISKADKYDIRLSVSDNEGSVYANGEEHILDGDEMELLRGIIPQKISKAGLYRDRTDLKSYIRLLAVHSEDYDIDCDFVTGTILPFEKDDLPVREGRALIPCGITLAGGNLDPAPVFRKEFRAGDMKIESARLYASALGIMDIAINSEKVTENLFEPGAAVYDSYVNYSVYDVTDLIKESSDNAISCTLGHGWYDRTGGEWGDKRAWIAGLEIRYADGTSDRIVTDSDWRCSDGPVRFDDFYQGETYDARFEDKTEGWDEGGFDDSSWEAVSILETDLLPEYTPRAAVKVLEEIKPVSVKALDEDTVLADFGRQLSGRVRIRVMGSEGDIVTIRHGEYLNDEKLIGADDEPGRIYTANLLRAANTDRYIFGSNKEATFEPELVWRSFRYVQINGIDSSKAAAEDFIVAVSASSASDQVYSFDSGSDTLNRIVDAMHVSGVCNSVDHPSDCPQRDERLSWAGDYNFYAPAAVYQDDQVLIMRHFMKAMAAGQGADGAYHDIAFIRAEGIGNPGWGDAGVTVPYLLYKYYGDDITCGRYYDSMAAYGEYLYRNSEDFIYPAEAGEYGDLSALNDVPADLVHTASCIRVMGYLSEMARVLGRTDDAEHFAEYEDNYVKAFRERFIDANGIIASWTESSYAMPLALGVYPESIREQGYSYLHTCVDAAGYTQTTGYAASGYLLPALAMGGYADDAYQILLSTDDNSWGGLISKYDLTALPERLGVIRTAEDGRYRINGSLNHESGGSIGEFVYKYILGIDIDADSKRIIISPYPGRIPGYAEGSYDSVLGRISVSWKYAVSDDGADFVSYKVHIPEGTKAHLVLRGADGQVFVDEEVTGGDYVY